MSWCILTPQDTLPCATRVLQIHISTKNFAMRTLQYTLFGVLALTVFTLELLHYALCDWITKAFVSQIFEGQAVHRCFIVRSPAKWIPSCHLLYYPTIQQSRVKSKVESQGWYKKGLFLTYYKCYCDDLLFFTIIKSSFFLLL